MVARQSTVNSYRTTATAAEGRLLFLCCNPASVAVKSNAAAGSRLTSRPLWRRWQCAKAHCRKGSGDSARTAWATHGSQVGCGEVFQPHPSRAFDASTLPAIVWARATLPMKLRRSVAAGRARTFCFYVCISMPLCSESLFSLHAIKESAAFLASPFMGKLSRAHTI